MSVRISRATSHADLTHCHRIHAECFGYDDSHPGIGMGEWWLARDHLDPVAFCGGRAVEGDLSLLAQVAGLSGPLAKLPAIVQRAHMKREAC
mgnify:CR=1 FL=1